MLRCHRRPSNQRRRLSAVSGVVVGSVDASSSVDPVLSVLDCCRTHRVVQVVRVRPACTRRHTALQESGIVTKMTINHPDYPSVDTKKIPTKNWSIRITVATICSILDASKFTWTSVLQCGSGSSTSTRVASVWPGWSGFTGIPGVFLPYDPNGIAVAARCFSEKILFWKCPYWMDFREKYEVKKKTFQNKRLMVKNKTFFYRNTVVPFVAMSFSDSRLCHARLEHSRARDLPLPVGLSRRPFWFWVRQRITFSIIPIWKTPISQSIN